MNYGLHGNAPVQEVAARPPAPCVVKGPNGRAVAIPERMVIQHSIRDVLTLAGGRDGSGKVSILLQALRARVSSNL